MKTHVDIHLSKKMINDYVSYLLGHRPADLKFTDIFRIEEHISECHKCDKAVQEMFNAGRIAEAKVVENELKFMEMRSLINKIENNAGLLSDEGSKALIADILKNVDKFKYNNLTVYLNSKDEGNRMLSRIVINDQDSSFFYSTDKDDARSDEREYDVVNYKRVITSDKIKHRTEVFLDDKNKKLTVKLQKEQGDFSPKIALLRLDEETADENRIIIKEPEFNKQDKCYEYCFENLEKGSFFLFIEPLFLV